MGWPTSGFGCGAKQKGVTVSSNPLKSGGEGEIRTPGTLLTYTRFPIVLLRPARTPLHSVIDHRSKPNTCIAASKELQAKKSNAGRLLQIFWSVGASATSALIATCCHRIAKACGQRWLGQGNLSGVHTLACCACRTAHAVPVVQLSQCHCCRAAHAVALAVCKKLRANKARPAYAERALQYNQTSVLMRLVVLALFVFLLVFAAALFGDLRSTVEGPQAKDCHNGNAHSVQGQGVHSLILLTASGC